MAESVLTIVPASEKDARLIRLLALQIWPKTYAEILSPDQIDYMMNMMYTEDAIRTQMQKDHRFIIVYDADMPVGFAAYGAIEPSIYKLFKIYLMQSEQGKGKGKFIIQQIINDIATRGAVALQLNVNRYNKAKLFYEKLGFNVVRTEDIDIGNGYFMNDYIMEKAVVAPKAH